MNTGRTDQKMNTFSCAFSQASILQTVNFSRCQFYNMYIRVLREASYNFEQCLAIFQSDAKASIEQR